MFGMSKEKSMLKKAKEFFQKSEQDNYEDDGFFWAILSGAPFLDRSKIAEQLLDDLISDNDGYAEMLKESYKRADMIEIVKECQKWAQYRQDYIAGHSQDEWRNEFERLKKSGELTYSPFNARGEYYEIVDLCSDD